MAPPSKKLKVVHSDDDDLKIQGEETILTDSTSAKVSPHGEQDISGQQTVFVRSLNYSTTTESLSAHFSYIAPLKHATVVIDPSTKASRGFGFVTYTDPADAAKAVKEFNNKVFEGRHIKVEIAQTRHRDGGDGSAKPIHVAKAKEAEVKKRNPRLIVRNLAWSVKRPEQLTKYFEKFGKVKEVIIPRKDGKKFGPMAGFAFVTMKKEETARKAIEAVNGMEIEGRMVAVDWAIEKNEWQQKASGDSDDEEDVDAEGAEEMEMDQNQNEEDTEDEDDSVSGSDDAFEKGDDEDDSMSDMSDDTSSKPTISNDTTIFIRNIAFTTDEDGLYEHFKENFGPIRYARIVLEPETGRPRGTAFVSFYKEEDFETCIDSAPKNTVQSIPAGGKGNTKQSVLQSESLDPTGKYTLHGRVLSISRAVSKDEAGRLAAVGNATREKADQDKRRLFLINEGHITSSNPLYQKLSKADIQMREDSYKQRKGFLEKNPSLHLSLTRLSVRNIPRNITEKDLKMLARRALVEFATEVKVGKRERIGKEEAARGGADAKEEEAKRKAKGKGVVKQAKIVRENGGAGRSKGYGFIEYIGHRWALMGLRWLNGREVAHLTASETTEEKPKDGEKGKKREENNILDVAPEDRRRRLIVEFALENVQVVQRRKEKEKASKGRIPGKGKVGRPETLSEKTPFKKDGRKRKRQDADEGKKEKIVVTGKKEQPAANGDDEKKDKLAKAARIIARKRQKRRTRRGD